MNDSPGSVVFKAALQCRTTDVINLLDCEDASLDAHDDNGMSLLHVASATNNIALAHALLERGISIDIVGGPDRCTPLHVAAAGGHLEMLRMLLEAHADFTKRDAFGRTCLYYAATSSQPYACLYLWHVESNPPVAFVDDHGRTVLMAACLAGASEETIRILITLAGVNSVNCPDGTLGNTALHYGVMSGKRVVCRLLLEAGADKAIRNKNGETPLDTAQLMGFPAAILRPSEFVDVTPPGSFLTRVRLLVIVVVGTLGFTRIGC